MVCDKGGISYGKIEKKHGKNNMAFDSRYIQRDAGDNYGDVHFSAYICGNICCARVVYGKADRYRR